MKTTALIIVWSVVILCAVLFVVFERKKINIRKLTVIGVITAVSIAGRFVFAATPGFKPLTAIVIIAGMYLGMDGGFFCGALTTLISNFYFGQGPWTAFQILVWGGIGVITGIMAKPLKKSMVLTLLWGVVAGVLFSLLMDVYTVLWTLGEWSWGFYITAIGTALPYTIIYVVSNIIFLIALEKPFGRKINRIVEKYGIV